MIAEKRAYFSSEGFPGDYGSLDNQVREEGLKTKMFESLGVLAGGVAHEFNNALIGIVGNIELLEMGLLAD